MGLSVRRVFALHPAKQKIAVPKKSGGRSVYGMKRTEQTSLRSSLQKVCAVEMGLTRKKDRVRDVQTKRESEKTCKGHVKAIR